MTPAEALRRVYAGACDLEDVLWRWATRLVIPVLEVGPRARSRHLARFLPCRRVGWRHAIAVAVSNGGQARIMALTQHYNLSRRGLLPAVSCMSQVLRLHQQSGTGLAICCPH
jgi:hypothetical protein